MPSGAGRGGQCRGGAAGRRRRGASVVICRVSIAGEGTTRAPLRPAPFRPVPAGTSLVVSVTVSTLLLLILLLLLLLLRHSVPAMLCEVSK